MIYNDYNDSPLLFFHLYLRCFSFSIIFFSLYSTFAFVFPCSVIWLINFINIFVMVNTYIGVCQPRLCLSLYSFMLILSILLCFSTRLFGKMNWIELNLGLRKLSIKTECACRNVKNEYAIIFDVSHKKICREIFEILILFYFDLSHPLFGWWAWCSVTHKMHKWNWYIRTYKKIGCTAANPWLLRGKRLYYGTMVMNGNIYLRNINLLAKRDIIVAWGENQIQ